jgi:hypothetical protein
LHSIALLGQQVVVYKLTLEMRVVRRASTTPVLTVANANTNSPSFMAAASAALAAASLHHLPLSVNCSECVVSREHACRDFSEFVVLA